MGKKRKKSMFCGKKQNKFYSIEINNHLSIKLSSKEAFTTKSEPWTDQKKK